MSDIPRKRDLDGEYMRTADGRYWRLFVPAWWQVWRWLSWWRAKVRGHVSLTFKGDDYEGIYRVRVLPSQDGIVRSFLTGARVKERP